MTQSLPIHLVINADDYAYFVCTSRGILEAASSGSITATGIMANSDNLQPQIDWLNSVDNLDYGVHLNLTSGSPVTTVMQQKLDRYQGQFPGLYQMLLLLLRGQIKHEDILNEWRGQIERCRQLPLKFLNSHQHIHMLPNLLPIAMSLADDYQIPYVRQTLPDWHLHSPIRLGVLIRNLLLQLVNVFNRTEQQSHSPTLIGLNGSGRLSLSYLDQLFATLVSGKSYELMCHPGNFDSQEITDQALINYHQWQDELAVLQSAELQLLYKKYNIRLSGYA